MPLCTQVLLSKWVCCQGPASLHVHILGLLAVVWHEWLPCFHARVLACIAAAKRVHSIALWVTGWDWLVALCKHHPWPATTQHGCGRDAQFWPLLLLRFLGADFQHVNLDVRAAASTVLLSCSHSWGCTHRHSMFAPGCRGDGVAVVVSALEPPCQAA